MPEKFKLARGLHTDLAKKLDGDFVAIIILRRLSHMIVRTNLMATLSPLSEVYVPNYRQQNMEVA